MHPAADRPIYEASAALDKLLSQARAFRSGLAAIRIPLDAANDRLDHTEDLAAILISQLNSASAIVDAELERIQAAAEVAYARAHGIVALAANDDAAATLTTLVAGLRGGVL